jgi:Fe-S cluster assembly iron-binding protein IscA
VFVITNSAAAELRDRLGKFESNKLIRLQMRKSCFMKVKLTLEESVQPGDAEVEMDGFHFIIDKRECHYFKDKKLDFIPDQTGFKQFEII